MIALRGRERGRTRRVRGEAFSPRVLTGLLGWWEAARSTELAPGARVALWRDLSGNGRDATQPLPERQPTLLADGVNGLPALRFDGVEDVLVGRTGLAARSPLTLMVVVRGEAASPSGRIVSLGTLAPGEEIGVGVDAAGSRLALSTGLAPGSATGERATNVSALGWQVVSLVFVPGRPPELRSNGGAPLGFSIPEDGAGLNVARGAADPFFALGAAVGGVGAPTRMLLATALLFGRALDANERSRLERWIGGRYGLGVG